MSRTIITSKSNVVIGTTSVPVNGQNVILDHTSYTIQVTSEIDGRVVYSALSDYWHTTDGESSLDFPIYAIDETSGKYQIGTEDGGSTFNAWTWKDTPTKKNLKSIGWRQYNLNGTIAEEWFGVSTPPGAIADTDQPYYQLTSTGSPVNFSFTGPVNEAVQVYGDSTHGNFNSRTYFKLFVRTQGKTYASSSLPDVSRSATGPYSQAFPLSNSTDLNITDSDLVVNASPFTLSSITYYASAQSRTIGSAYTFNHIIDNSSAGLTRFQIYERVQYLLRQNSNINSGTSPNNSIVTGQTASQICWFVGPILYVEGAIDGLLLNDINFVVFIDSTGTGRTYPYASTGSFNFNSVITSTIGAKYKLFLTAGGPGAGDEYGTTSAIIVNDKNGNPISGNVSGQSTISWSFDYDGNIQASRTSGTDCPTTLIVTGPGGFKFVRTNYTITRSSGQTIPVNGVADPIYL